MKRKLVTLLTLALTVSLLCGCGGDSQANTDISSNEKPDTVSEPTEVLSEFLSTENTIFYAVSEMDKSVTPSNLYFFENGKLTILPGEEFGLTLGDFSQMDESKIWELYETVRIDYVQKYFADKEDYLMKMADNKVDNDYQLYFNYTALSEVSDARNKAKNGETSTYDGILASAFRIISAYCSETDSWEELYMILGLPANEVLSSDHLEPLFLSVENNTLDDAITYFQTFYSNIKTELASSYKFNGPFYDAPFSCYVVTDATGNQVEEEHIIFPTLEDRGSIPKTYFDNISFETAVSNYKIYDTTYTCLVMAGGSIYCTRNTVTLDTLDSKNVLVDPTQDELNTLYKTEVTSRYK